VKVITRVEKVLMKVPGKLDLWRVRGACGHETILVRPRDRGLHDMSYVCGGCSSDDHLAPPEKKPEEP
jgi:hypothetical protein